MSKSKKTKTTIYTSKKKKDSGGSDLHYSCICDGTAASRRGACIIRKADIVYNIQKTGMDVKYIRDYFA